MGPPHDHRSEKAKQLPLQGFREVVRQHLQCGTMHNLKCLPIHLVLDPEIADVDMPGVTGTRVAAICLHLHATHVVLEKTILFQLVTLRLHEVLHPYVVWKVVTSAHDLGFGGTFRVEFLFACFPVDDARAKTHGTTRMTFHIVVDCITRINPRDQTGQVIGGNDPHIIEGLIQKL